MKFFILNYFNKIKNCRYKRYLSKKLEYQYLKKIENYSKIFDDSIISDTAISNEIEMIRFSDIILDNPEKLIWTAYQT